MKCNLRRELNKLKPNLKYSKHFMLSELDVALSKMKSGKAAELDNIYPEFLKHLGPLGKIWLLNFFNLMLDSGVIPAIF